MKTNMKKSLFNLLLGRGLEGDRFLWGLRGLLTVVWSGLGVIAFAQSAEICNTDTYPIASAMPASGVSTYRWLENGQIISGATAITYTVPGGKQTGVYTYIRQSKSADCPDWQSSNEFTVTVFDCSFSAGTETSATATFIDPRDGKSYKTVVMPDGRTWFAQNLNYTKDLTVNGYSYEANGKPFTSATNGVPAIGSYWCPPVFWVNGAGTVPVASGSQGACDVYGALYTWETAMMVDGKYADEAKTGSVWEESWVSPNYFDTGAPGSTANADKNNARGTTNVKGGGRGICPMGWHIPTDREWAAMLDKVEGAGSGSTYSTSQTGTDWWGVDAGKKLKSAATFTTTDPGTGSWLDNANRGTNEFGFGMVPAGYRGINGSQFLHRGTNVYYWSSSVASATYAWRRLFGSSHAQVNRYNNSRSRGFSVRCIKD
jgi:uncharacterized protein (TIGR02145 family)